MDPWTSLPSHNHEHGLQYLQWNNGPVEGVSDTHTSNHHRWNLELQATWSWPIQLGPKTGIYEYLEVLQYRCLMVLRTMEYVAC